MKNPHASLPENRETSRAGQRKSISVAGLLLGALLLASPAAAACAGNALPAAPATLLRTELFLGRGLPGGGVVSARDWARFERQVLGPRLCGYTVLDARGGWVGADGRLQREPAKLVILLHRPDLLPAIDAVAAEWRRRFRQEAVLRATQPAEGGLLTR